MNKNKSISLLLFANTGADVIVELFHASSNRCETYAANHLNNQPGFVTNGIPLLTAEGIQQVAIPDVKGLIYWLNDIMTGTDNTGLQEWTIQSTGGVKFSYRSILNYLSSKRIKITKVKLQGVMTDINNQWKILRYFLDGSYYENIINTSSAISPEQVRNNVLEFNVNEIIDGNTAIEVLIKAGRGYSINFEFEEI